MKAVLQKIKYAWSKNARGGKYASKRSHNPKAFKLNCTESNVVNKIVDLPVAIPPVITIVFIFFYFLDYKFV